MQTLNASNRFSGRLPTLAEIRAEKARRQAERERERIARDGERIRTRCQTLAGFVREAWHVLEPEQPYIHGWHVDAICAHLEAVTDGRITRLLINIPPGTMKSLLVSVFWPAWEWGPKGLAAHRYLTTSYAEKYVKRDSRRMRDLVQSDWFRSLWPEIELVRAGEMSFANTRTGTREGMAFASLTGGRGDRVICFPYWERVETENGPVPIGAIVEGSLPARLWSANIETGEVALRPVAGWVRNPPSELVEVGLSDGSSVTCTPDHRIWTERGWVRAALLRPSDRLPVAPRFDHLHRATRNPVPIGESAMSFNGPVDSNGLVCGQLGPGRGLALAVIAHASGVAREGGPRFSASDLLNGGRADTVTFADLIGGKCALGDFLGYVAIDLRAWTALVLRECSMAFGIGNIRRSSAVAEVFKAAVSWVAVAMSDFFAGKWGPAKCQHHALVDEQNFGYAVTSGVESRIAALAAWGAKQNALFDRAPDPILHDGFGPGFGSNPSEIADAVIPIEANYRTPIFVRHAGHADATYCLTVEGNHTFYAGNGNRVLVANCDDPHSTETAESETERENVTRIFRESVTTRLNDPQRSAIVVIMQRLHAKDVSGQIETLGLGYDHLMLPMEFEAKRRCGTSIGFTDPRTAEGELLFPERFSRAVVERDKAAMGSYAVAGQFQQRPAPREGGMFKRGWFEVVEAAPAHRRKVRRWDLAGTEQTQGNDPDWTVGLLLSESGGVYYIEGVVRDRLSPAGVSKLIQTTASQDGKRVPVRIPQDPGAAGKAAAQAQIRLMPGYDIRAEIESGSKEVRATPVAAQAEAGNVKLVRGSWNEAFLEEVSMFPNAPHDDQVDALSGAFASLLTVSSYTLSNVA